MIIKTITFHFTRNYGATLQAYALYKYLDSQGHDVEVIDYLPDAVVKTYSLFYMKSPSLKNLLVTLLRAPFLLVRNIMFSSFLKQHVALTKKYSNYSDLKKSKIEGDAFIAGSDQIWNSKITSGMDPAYCLDFVEKGMKISYAASFGEPVFDEDLKYVADHVKDFSAISVREESATTLLGKYLLDNKCEVVPDPVFLLGKDDYSALFNHRKDKTKYLLIYEIQLNPRLFEIAQKIAIEKSLKIYVIAKNLSSRKVADKMIFFCGPVRFLELIYNAEYIVTNSFHASSFAIIMNKDFNSVTESGRVVNLLKKFGLRDRLVLDDIITTEPIEYTSINRLLTVEKERAQEFLLTAMDADKDKYYS